MKWVLTADRPIYAQLVEQMTMLVISGEWRAGEKLLSVRDLAEQASVNPNTMQKALAELERDGLVFTQRTTGRYVTEDHKMLEEKKTTIARQQVRKFLEQMRQLGFTGEQMIDLMRKEANHG